MDYLSSSSRRCEDIHKLSTLWNYDAPSYSTRVQYLRLWLAHASRSSRPTAIQSVRYRCPKATRIIGRVHILVLHFVPSSAVEGIFPPTFICWCSDWWLFRRRLSMSQKHLRSVTKCYISDMTIGKLFVHPWSIVWRLRLSKRCRKWLWLSVIDDCECWQLFCDSNYQVWGRRTSSTKEARLFIRPTFTKGDGCTAHSQFETKKAR